jgi:hypothetical protein
VAATVSAMNGKPSSGMAETAALLTAGLGLLSWHLLGGGHRTAPPAAARRRGHRADHVLRRQLVRYAFVRGIALPG